MAARENCYDFLSGNQWTDEEREVAKQKKKALVEFNKLIPSKRAFVGAMLQQRYDVKPSPRTPQSQNKSDIYAAVYHWQADTCDVKYKDPQVITNAWAGGSSWQESYVEITPGKKPRVICTNQNDFAMYPDPNRRDLVNNSDCEFIDRISWMAKDAIVEAFPDMEAEIEATLQTFVNISYDETKTYADRTHEWENIRNGKFKVIERFYKVRKKNWFGEQGGNRIDIGQDADLETRTQFKQDYPDHKLYFEREELLYLAIACPAMGQMFLYNNEYHCQPRDVVTDRIMFPFVELVDEDLNGQPAGHVAPQIGPIKVLNSLAVNTIFAVKNAAGQGHIISADHFDEQTATDMEENLADGSRSFRKKPSAPPGPGVDLIPQGGAPRDNNSLMSFVSDFAIEVSSTSPQMKGETVSSESGVLNEQRIQQSAVQSQVFTNNYMSFMTRRAKLWKYYWKEYFKAEDIIPILDKKDENDPDWIEINKIVQDEFGNVQTMNSLDDADAYDICFEDSYRSPTMRDKILKQISQLQQNGATANDPEMASFLNYIFITTSDLSQQLKSKAKELYDKREQAAQQPPQPKPPDPIRLSMSLAAADLHDQAVIALLEANQAITPEVAQQMQGSPQQPAPDAGAAPSQPPAPSGPSLPELQATLAGKHIDNLSKMAKTKADVAHKKAQTHGQHLKNLQQAGAIPMPQQSSPGMPPSPQTQQPSMAGA